MSIFGKPFLTGVGKGSASGAVASFTDGAKGLPLKSLLVGIDPVQDLHGYDNPWPAGGGKNLFDKDTMVTNSGTGYIGVDGEVVENNQWRHTSYIPVRGTQFTVSHVSGVVPAIALYDENKALLVAVSIGSNGAASYINKTITAQSDAYYCRFSIYNDSTLDTIQLESGSTATSYAPYSNICPISGWSAVNLWDDPKHGGNILWNQLIENGDFTEQSGWSATYGTGAYGTKEYIYTLTNIGNDYQNRIITSGISIIAGHKYYVTAQVKTPYVGGVYITGYSSSLGDYTINGTRIGYTTAAEYTTLKGIVTGGNTANCDLRISLSYNNKQSGDEYRFKNIMLCDLTAMFGEGSEPTAEQFSALFHDDYYDYDTGTYTTVSAVNGDPYLHIPITIPTPPGTVYGGYIQVAEDGNAELVVDRAYLSITWGEMSNSSVNDGVERRRYTLPVIQDFEKRNNSICNCLKWKNGVGVDSPGSYKLHSTAQYLYAYLPENTSDATQIAVCYYIATPVTYPLTPQEISTLKGVNNIWADTGNSTVEYLKQSLMHIGSTIRPPHYGCVWDQENAQMRRTGLARTITTNTQNFKHSGSVNPNYDNPFDSIYPWSERKLCNISLALYQALQPGDNIKDCVTYWETDDGFSYNDPDGVWVYTPEFWGTSYWIGSQRYFEVSPVELAGYHHYKEQITARWRGTAESRTIGGTSKTILLSKPGMPIVRTALSTIHKYANNAGMTLDNIYSLDASLLLYLVEYANYNAQAAIGNGVSALYRQSSDLIKADATASTVVQIEYSSAILALCIPGAIFDIGTANGGVQVGSFIIQSAAQDTVDNTLINVMLDRAVTVTTANYWSIHGLVNHEDSEIGSKSGYIGTNGKADAYYRGEALWGNMFYYVLGAYKSDTEYVWLATAADADNYDALDTSNHTNTGIKLAEESGKYILKLGFPDAQGTLSAPALCTAVPGSASNPVGDYFYTTVGSNRVLLVGGSARHGSNAGPFYWSWDYAAASSNWYSSCRPLLKTP